MVRLYRITRRLFGAAAAAYGWPHWLLLLVLAAVTAVYWPTLREAFHGDDFVAFQEFRSYSFWDYSERVFLFQDSNFYWRPLGKISHYLLYEFYDFDTFPYRLYSLGLFLATLVAIYAFCLRENMGRAVAVGAALVFGLLPNHVVSVTWVTNNSRLMAVLFMLIGMILLQTPGTRRRFYHEFGAFFFMVGACLSDETALALVPVPVLYATLVNPGRWPQRPLSLKEASHALPTVLRLGFYGALIGIIAPLNLEYGVGDEPRLLFYGVGPHVLTQTWALTSQLVLPLTDASPIDLLVRDIPTVQWIAGALAIAGGGLALVVGSRWLKLLVIWTAVGLAPFTLWDLNYTSPRYVYMSAVPFAIILSWGVCELAPMLLRALRFLPLRVVGAGAMAVALAAVVVVSVQTVQSRDATWSEQTAKYRPLAEDLQTVVKDPKKGSRLVIYYGYWQDFWASAVVRSVYGDRTLHVVSVPGKVADTNWPRPRPNDIVLYYLEDHFVQMGLASSATR